MCRPAAWSNTRSMVTLLVLGSHCTFCFRLMLWSLWLATVVFFNYALRNVWKEMLPLRPIPNRRVNVPASCCVGGDCILALRLDI